MNLGKETSKTVNNDNASIAVEDPIPKELRGKTLVGKTGEEEVDQLTHHAGTPRLAA